MAVIETALTRSLATKQPILLAQMTLGHRPQARRR
jgi:hypothetical protein